MVGRLAALVILALAGLVRPSPLGSDCTGTINSLDSIAAAVKCTTIVIEGFTVPAGETFQLNVLSGTSITMSGDVTFGEKNWAGPLFEIVGTSVTFNGNGHTFNGDGAFYWDGQGINGGVTKPDPMMKLELSGTWENVKVLNSPARVYSISPKGRVIISGVTVDNSAGASLGANTDGFDVSGNDVTIENSSVINQDDCLAINKGTGITFKGNTCSGGHGISIGSISSSVSVSGITISGNTIKNSVQALRIKTDASASGSTVTDITYSGNKASGISKFGVLIDQSYPSTLGTAGKSVALSNVKFIDSMNTIAVNSGAVAIAVNCGDCSGTWDWSDLTVTGSSKTEINYSSITGYKV